MTLLQIDLDNANTEKSSWTEMQEKTTKLTADLEKLTHSTGHQNPNTDILSTPSQSF